MTPFQEFRLWARRAPANERLSAGLATAIVLALLIWVAVPSSSRANSSSAFPTGSTQTTTQTGATGTPGGSAGGGGVAPSASGGPLAGASAPGATGSTANGSGTGTTGATSGTTTGQGAQGCKSPAASGPGVSATQIKVAVIVTQIAGATGNSAFNVAAPSLQKASYQAAIDDINASGGAGCRKLVAQYFAANPADQSNLQQVCFDISQGGFFAVLDTGSFSSTSTLYTCFAQRQIAYFSGYLIQESLRQKFYPYVFGFDTYDRIYHDAVFALKSKGFFDPGKGFKKLGLPYRNCFPEEFNQMMGWLAQAGVPSSQVVTYNVGCPAVFASPADLQQAVLKFKQAGVTNVTYVQFTGDIANFTNDAQQQGAHWKYGLPDDQLVTTSYGNMHPNYQQFNGAITVAENRDGEETTPGYSKSSATARCDAILAKHGVQPTYKQPYAVGNACDQVWMLAAAVDHAPAIQTNALAAGLLAARSVDWSFPQGPNDFTGRGVTTGGQYYRFDTFSAACKCWRVSDRTYHRSSY